jgi:hypothetical protein
MKLGTLQRVTSTNTGSFDAKDLGIVSSVLDETDEISFSQKNLDGESRVQLFIYTDPTSAPYGLSCSKRLSKTVRKALGKGNDQDTVLASLMSLTIWEQKGIPFISPDGDKKVKLTVKQLLALNKMSYQDLASAGR